MNAKYIDNPIIDKIGGFDDSEIERNDEVTTDICPNRCGGRLIKSSVSNGADDVQYTWTCEKCGDTFSN